MNMDIEKVISIAEQFGATYKQNLGIYQFREQELLDFVESIVTECLVQCSNVRNETQQGTRDLYNMGREMGAENCYFAIQNYFSKHHGVTNEQSESSSVGELATTRP